MFDILMEASNFSYFNYDVSFPSARSCMFGLNF